MWEDILGNSKYCFYNKKTGDLSITLPKYFRNKIWAEEFGDLYFFIKDSNIGDIAKIHIDCRNTLWIDPIPLLSLLVLFNQHAPVPPNNFLIHLPSVKTHPKSYSEKQSNIFLKFLFEEGFLDKMNSIASISNHMDGANFVEFEKKIEKLTVDLNYYDCHILNTRVFDASLIHEGDHECVFYDEIDIIINEIRVNLLNKKVPTSHLNNLLYKVRLFFSETINNVYQHAYPKTEFDTSKNYLAIYARYRYGMQHNAIESYKEKLSALLKKEVVNSSDLFKDCKEMIFDLRDGCIELFIIDVGVGIASSTGYRKKEKHPTRKAYSDILNTAQARTISTTTINQTKNGGLYVIGKHIEATKDFILFKDFEDWLGGILPERRHNAFFERINSLSGFHTSGCVFQATISWYPVNERQENWEYIKEPFINNLLSIYKIRDVNRLLLEEYIFIDERIIDYPNIIEKKNNIKNIILNKKCDTIIYLPHSGMTKHLLAFVILETIAEYAVENTTLIIADIPDDERIVYYEAINQVSYTVEIGALMKKIKNIHLISNSLHICSFFFADNQFIQNKKMQKDFYYNQANDMNISKLLEILVTHDSYLIWTKVKEEKDIFVNSSILWHENEYINQYLDFNRLCFSETFIKLFLIGMKRVLGLYYPKTFNFISFDLLVENLVSRLKGIYSNSGCNVLEFDIGSVYAKGVTQNEKMSGIIPAVAFHCFQHPSLFSKPILKLFFWPKEDWINKHFIREDKAYMRIGRTPFISQYGWDYFTVPRYLPDESSFYFISPKESYLIWQNPQIGLRLGSLKYGSHYDFITINIEALIEKSFLEKGKLARFLVTSFYLALTNNKLDKKKTSFRNFSNRYDSDFSDSTEYFNLFEKYDDQNKYIIVYPNHTMNSFIIRKIRSILDDDIMDKVIPLDFIRNDNSKTNLLFSPLNFQKIKGFMQSSSCKVIYFDDAVVSGRTRKETKHLLFSLGAKEVKTLAIFDRQRLPFSVPNKITNNYFCRLDIPRLGVGNTNILMISIRRASRARSMLIGTAKSRVEAWQKMWSINDSLGNFNLNMLYPINLKPFHKKFSTKRSNGGNKYSQIGGDKNKLLITNSIGLIAYTLELFCMTGKDDLVIKYCKDKDIDDKVKIELICCHLLLYGQELRKSLKYEMAEILLQASNYNMVDSYTSLAAITILTQDQEFISELSKSKYFENNCNFDIQIAFAINSVNTGDNLLNDSYNNIISQVKEQNNQGLINLKDFHRQIYEKKATHISPLHAVVNGNKLEKSRFSALKISLEKLEWHCKHLFPHYYVDDQVAMDNIQQIKFTLDSQTPNYRNDIIDNLENKLLPNLENIHRKLFFEITSKDFSFEMFIKKIFDGITVEDWQSILREKRKNAEETIKISSNDMIQNNEFKHNFYLSDSAFSTINNLKADNLLHIYIPMNNEIKSHLSNLIKNYIHGDYKPIKDPFSNKSLPLSHIWYTCEYSEENKTFSFLIANSISYVTDYTEADRSRHKQDIKNLQIDLDLKYELKSNNIIIAKFKFPTI
jgi:hypothetical protein